MARTKPPVSGTLTFLFTDIEGSTERWERDREAMSDALRRHDAIVQTVIERHHGRVFKTIGDAYCAAFPSPSEALNAALAIQRSLSREDFAAVGGLRVRIAMHTGIADERDGDFFGPPVNRVARLLAIGHGGQVLVSSDAFAGLRSDLPQDVSLRDLGAHRLKDLAQPERVYQLIAADLPVTFPALRSLGSRPNNLPPQLTSFVGRADVLAEVGTMVERSRLVTLVGSGGVGKTRCALQIGVDALARFTDGVWFVDLSPVGDASAVAATVARTLGLHDYAATPIDIVTKYLSRKDLLLILDNCEHVIDEARSVAAAILHGCPSVHILATSRERLHIGGEQAYRMPSLAVPTNDVRSAHAASTFGAVQLFVERALNADRRFELSDENAGDVGEISRRLDGIPLALELAAARIAVLTPRELAKRLDERFRASRRCAR